MQDQSLTDIAISIDNETITAENGAKAFVEYFIANDCKQLSASDFEGEILTDRTVGALIVALKSEKSPIRELELEDSLILYTQILPHLNQMHAITHLSLFGFNMSDDNVGIFVGGILMNTTLKSLSFPDISNLKPAMKKVFYQALSQLNLNEIDIDVSNTEPVVDEPFIEFFRNSQVTSLCITRQDLQSLLGMIPILNITKLKSSQAVLDVDLSAQLPLLTDLTIFRDDGHEDGFAKLLSTIQKTKITKLCIDPDFEGLIDETLALAIQQSQLLWLDADPRMQQSLNAVKGNRKKFVDVAQMLIFLKLVPCRFENTRFNTLNHDVLYLIIKHAVSPLEFARDDYNKMRSNIEKSLSASLNNHPNRFKSLEYQVSELNLKVQDLERTLAEKDSEITRLTKLLSAISSPQSNLVDRDEVKRLRDGEEDDEDFEPPRGKLRFTEQF